MWERKTKTAAWNGLAFNIRQTTLDNGKRLDVAELPYADEPHIKVTGSKARGVNIEAVFVGVNSLVDANAFVAELESEPVGTLDHPYLGEMKLVYESSSQSFSTKKGLVTLSIKFLKQGKDVVLTRARIDEKPISELSKDVMLESKRQFIRDIATASPEQISTLLDDFNSLLNTLKSIANRATQASARLTRLHHQIQDAINAVNTIINAPGAYADHLSALFDNLTAVFVGERSNQPASKALANCINPASAFSHFNIQITVALVLLSEELVLLSSAEQLEISTFEGDPIDSFAAEVNAISDFLDDRISEVTQAANYESLALIEPIDALQEVVIKQRNKVNTLLLSVVKTEVFSKRPLLCIAQSKECTGAEISSLNSIPHPLFVSGFLRVPNE